MLTTELRTRADPDVAAHARRVLERAVPAMLQDDRFDDSWLDSVSGDRAVFVAALASYSGEPVGYVGGAVWRRRLLLEALVVASPGETEAEILETLLTMVVGRASSTDATTVELWAKPAHPWHATVADGHGLRLTRQLQQMRCRLPVDAPRLTTRPFVGGDDHELLRMTNNRAFAGHPDQGALTSDELAARLQQPWVRTDGIRLHFVDGRLAGFCWTKIHADGIGEIYAIAVDPDFHGRGLGVPVTASGLHWLADNGIETGMLYVESDNEPAVRTYERLGFEVVRTDRAWEGALDDIEDPEAPVPSGDADADD